MIDSITFDGGGVGTAGVFYLQQANGVGWAAMDSLSELDSASSFDPAGTPLSITDGSGGASRPSSVPNVSRQVSFTQQHPRPRQQTHPHQRYRCHDDRRHHGVHVAAFWLT
jgi:hypothetical protein